MKECYVCNKKQCSELLNFGNQPICHRFLANNDREKKYPLILGQCQSCGLVQLMVLIPPKKLAQRYDWVKYNEPEAHLKFIAERIRSLPGISQQSKILGVGPHDVSLLRRMHTEGYHYAEIVNKGSSSDHELTEECDHSFDSNSDALVSDVRSARCASYDVVVARRILEHASDPLGFLRGLRSLVAPGGYIVIEVPDSQQAFEGIDVGVIWEEHVLYFTSETFRECLTLTGFNVLSFDNFIYPQENSLVAIVQPDDKAPAFMKGRLLDIEKKRASDFATNLIQLRKVIHKYFTGCRKQGNKIAVLGAGHRSCMYINLLQLKEFIEFVIDDDPNKQNLRMPGSKLPIRGSKALMDYRIKLCLLGINPESEDKVINKNRAFVESGGVFASISPDSKFVLQI